MGAEKKFIATALNNEDKQQLKREIEHELEKYQDTVNQSKDFLNSSIMMD